MFHFNKINQCRKTPTKSEKYHRIKHIYIQYDNIIYGKKIE